MREFLNKFRSRKFLAALSGVIIGAAMIFGISEDTLITVAGAITSVASIISYIIAESRVDAVGVSSAQTGEPGKETVDRETVLTQKSGGDN